MFKSRVRAEGAITSQLWLLISWDRGAKGGERGIAGVKAAMRGSRRSPSMTGHAGEYLCARVTWWGSGAGLMWR